MAEQKCAFVAILGAPNAGKSTLLNHIIGSKISIVSPKVQTTRGKVRGIFIKDNTQLILVDTAGIFKPSCRLDRAMVAGAWTESDDADMRLVLVDATKGLDNNTNLIIQNLTKTKKRAILAINKIDQVTPTKLATLATQIGQMELWDAVFYVSAKTGKGIPEMMDFLCTKATTSPWLFDSDEMTDMPDRLFAAEGTREKLFMNLKNELPYHLTVETTAFKEAEKSIRIEQNIIVERAAHRMIILGRGGQMIKKIGQQSRLELTKQLHKKVSLFLFVKVRENWAEDPTQYKPWGLDFNA